MTTLPSQKTPLRLLGFFIAFLLAVLSAPLSHAESQGQYVDAISHALPAGKTIDTASKKELQAAIQRVVLAHPGDVAKIAAAITSAADLSRANEIAEAIGELFASNPRIAAVAPEIGRAMARSLDAKLTLYADTKPVTLRDCATQIGYVASTLAYYLNPVDPASRDEVVELIRMVASVNPKLDYTNVIVATFVGTLRNLGVSDGYLNGVQEAVLASIHDSSISQQVRSTLASANGGLDIFAPGMINLHETPVSNG